MPFTTDIGNSKEEPRKVSMLHKKILTATLAFGVICFAGGLALIYGQHKLDNRTRMNMAPNSVYLRTKPSVEGGITGDIELYGTTKDYDNDGRLEGVLYAMDSKGNKIDSALVRFGPDSSVTYTRFRVVNGNIEYLLD